MKRKQQVEIKSNGNGFHKDEEIENGSEEENESEVDSDVELQEAFAKKLLKPGLNIELPAPKKFINNQDALKRKLDDLYLKMDWIERFDITVKKNNGELGIENEEQVADQDFKREHSFFQQAQSAVLEGLKKIRVLGLPTERPDDFYAEMAKTDQHMKKVKEVLLSKEAELEKREKIRKLRELKKIGKQVQRENLKKKHQEKKQFNDKIEDIKKGKESVSVLDEKNNSKRKANQKKGESVKNKKRQFKDTKYGYGGRKKRSKLNTTKSSSNFNDFNPKIHGNKSNKKLRNKNKPKSLKKMKKGK